MRFMVVVHPGNPRGYEAGEMPGADLLEKMGKFNQTLIEAGVMLTGEGLHPSVRGLRVHFDKGNTSVSNGPFPGAIGGFWLWKVKSKEEALGWVKRAPMEDGATLELRQVFEPEDFDQGK